MQREYTAFAVVNVAEETGYVTQRYEDEAWTPEHPNGWTYQEVAGFGGTIIYEGRSVGEASEALRRWLEQL